MFSLFGCAQNTPKPDPVAVEPGKVAIVYFSWSPDGNTRFAADRFTGASLRWKNSSRTA